MSELWQAIQTFRLINTEATGKNSTQKATKDDTQNKQTDSTKSSKQTQSPNVQLKMIFKMYPATYMMANLAFKLLLHCKGKSLFCDQKKDFPLHEAVFEGNL